MERNIVIGNLQVESQESRVESQSLKPKAQSPNNQKGFTLLELMIAMFIMIILLSVALPTYQRSIQHARETVLQENLWQMDRAIDQYAADKGKFPQSLDDLVKDEYLREMPIDPITEKAEWNEIKEEDTLSPDGGQVLKDIKSLAAGEDSNGKKYEDY